MKKDFFHPKYPFGAKLMKKRSGSVAVNHNIILIVLQKFLHNLLGIPYKWGGKTTLGFDCSGLVQAVLECLWNKFTTRFNGSMGLFKGI